MVVDQARGYPIIIPATPVITAKPVSWRSGLAATFITLAWFLTTARVVPVRDGDRGVFASVAERLVAGDRLYVDVWDNKEPLFYLTLSLGRTVSPYMDVVLELLWLLIGSYATYAIARTFHTRVSTGLLTGFAVAPLILTGSAYYAGFTHLPGTILVLSSFALLVRGHLLAAGLLLPVIGGFKILALPVALAMVVAYLVLHRTLTWVRYLIGVGVGSAALAILLILRGELVGFLNLIRTNITYSQSDIADAYEIPIWRHLEPVLQGPTIALLATILLILALTRSYLNHETRDLWWVTVTVSLAALIVVVATGLWPHHGQIFFLSGVLAAVLVTAALPTFESLDITAFVGIAAVAVLLSGAPSLRDTADDILSAPSRLADLGRVADATASLAAVAPSGSSYARLGKNTDDTHAQGLRDLDLACYQFLQYPYDPPENLERIPECLSNADFLIVDPTFTPEPGQDAWNSFVTDASEALLRAFDCQSQPWGDLCVNRMLVN